MLSKWSPENYCRVNAIQAAIKNLSFKICVPEFLLKLFLGERIEMLLSSQRVSNKKITDAGFAFRFSNPLQAIKNCLDENI